MAHFAHYVKREVVEVDYQSPDDPWFAEHQPDDQGFATPAYHVSQAVRGPATRVTQGDTIWLFSQLRTPWGVYPPALDAKIIVSEVSVRRARRSGEKAALRFGAGEGSSWFPLCDASDTVAELTTVNAQGGVQKLLAERHQPIGRVLQSMRELAEAAPLIALERRISELGFDFISYRLLDGTRRAFEASLQLVQAGGAVWWDRWSLPRRLAERREFLNDSALDEFISERIGASINVWGIPSPKYAEPQSYSWKERELSSRLKKFRFREWPKGKDGS